MQEKHKKTEINDALQKVDPELGLQAFRSGLSAERAAVKGHRKACRRIAFRKCLDLISAVVYLMTFKTESFKAVLKAHEEYGKLALSPSEDEIRKYLEDYGRKSSVRGIYKKWIILASMLKGENIFSSVKEQDFYM